MPCLDEAESLGICIQKARAAIEAAGLEAEIVIADNGSTDGSVEIAERLGARVVHQPARGYGNALQAGFRAARGRYLIMGDADDSYDWSEIERFIEPLRQGREMVMGTRLKGRIEPGAMPFLHRYLGNPVLTGILNLLFGAGISDAHCGMRSITREAYARLDLRATGMEFASEMVIKAARADLRIGEIPITLHPDRRTRPPHLRTWRDGWRHLRFMLLYSPTALFLVPGLALFLLGIAVLAVLYPAPLHIAGRMIDVHTMTLGGLCLILGVQILSLGLFARVYAREHRFVREDRFLARLAPHASLERGVLVGLVIFGLGFLLDLEVAVEWIRSGFGPLDALRNAILGSTLMAAGAQVIFASFFLSVLTLRAAEDPVPDRESV